MLLRDETVRGFKGARGEVEEMLRRRDPFGSIEAFIESVDLDPDFKAALWLLAWSEQDYLKRKGIINEAFVAAAQARG